MLPPKTTVWAVYATFADGQRHILIAFVEAADAHQHVAKCLRQPYDEDGRPLLSAAEILGIQGLAVAGLPVW
jgi:hypothetical protein